MPLHTEALIKQLCRQALAAETQADVDSVVPKLRHAIAEHIRLAKESLETQAGLLAIHSKHDLVS